MLLNEWTEVVDLSSRKVRVQSHSTLAMKRMFNSTLESLGGAKSDSKFGQFIHWFACRVCSLVKVRVRDVQFGWIDSYYWAWGDVFLSTSEEKVKFHQVIIPTVLFMPSLDLEGELASFEDVKVCLIPASDSCQF